MKTNNILLYTKSKIKADAVDELCSELGLLKGEIKNSDINKTLSEVLGIPCKKKSEGATAPMLYVMPELMIFNGLSSDKLDDFLALYRKKGIEPIAHKAVVTPYNLSWSLYELIAQLDMEINNIK